MLKILIFSLLLSILSWFISISVSNDFLANFFGLVYVLAAFVALAFFIVEIALVFLKLIGR